MMNFFSYFFYWAPCSANRGFILVEVIFVIGVYSVYGTAQFAIFRISPQIGANCFKKKHTKRLLRFILFGIWDQREKKLNNGPIFANAPKFTHFFFKISQTYAKICKFSQMFAKLCLTAGIDLIDVTPHRQEEKTKMDFKVWGRRIADTIRSEYPSPTVVKPVKLTSGGCFGLEDDSEEKVEKKLKKIRRVLTACKLRNKIFYFSRYVMSRQKVKNLKRFARSLKPGTH